MTIFPLTPCPFCGSERALVHPEGEYSWRVRCPGCGATGPSSHTQNGAETRWCQRAEPEKAKEAE